MSTWVKLVRNEDCDQFSIAAVDENNNVVSQLHAIPENLTELGESLRRAFPSKVTALSAEGVA